MAELAVIFTGALIGLGAFVTGFVALGMHINERDLLLIPHTRVHFNFAPESVTWMELKQQNATLHVTTVTHEECAWVWAGTERGGTCGGFDNSSVPGLGLVNEPGANGWFVGLGPGDGQVFEANWTTEIPAEFGGNKEANLR